MYKAFSENKKFKKYYIISRMLPAVETNYLFIYFFFLSIVYNTNDVRGMRSSLLLLRKKTVYEHTR